MNKPKGDEDATHPGTVLLSRIRTDGDTQPRAGLDSNVVKDYTERMQAGVEFLPIDLFCDGENYWLADGFHRYEAANCAHLQRIRAEIHQGTQEDARWYSVGTNQTHGLQRSNEDKQRAVERALRHPRGAGLSDRKIAEHVGVDHKTVSAWREKLSGEIPQMKTRTATRKGKEYQINISNIGKHSHQAPAEEFSPEQGIAEGPAGLAAAGAYRPEQRPAPEPELPGKADPIDDLAAPPLPDAQLGPTSGVQITSPGQGGAPPAPTEELASRAVPAEGAVPEEPVPPQREVKPAPAGTAPAQPRIEPLPAREASSESRVISSWSEEEKLHVEALTTILSGLADVPEIERGSALLGALPNDVLAAAALIFLDEDDVVDHPAMQALMAAVCFIFGDESVGWDKPNEEIIALIQRVAYACVIELADVSTY